MTFTIQNDPLATLARELAGLVDKPIPRPTQQEYHSLMRVKNALKELPEEAKLSSDDETTRQGLVVMAYRVLDGMENFYENNGNKWADKAA